MANWVDPDQISPKKQSDLGLHCLPIFVSLFWMNRVDLDSTAVNVFYTDKVYGNLRNKRWLKFEIKLICNLPYSILKRT